MSLDACKRGFLSGCRPLICLDGCHIKTKFEGRILTVVGIDPNDCIYPITLVVVETESLSSWRWFLETLKYDLGIDNTYPWTIMTDKQKGLIPAAEHRFDESSQVSQMNLAPGPLLDNQFVMTNQQLSGQCLSPQQQRQGKQGQPKERLQVSLQQRKLPRDRRIVLMV